LGHATRHRVLRREPPASGGVASGLLLAPIKATGAETDPTYRYLRDLNADAEDVESSRLLYVAATRAENRLHLLARRIVVPHPRGGIIDVTAPLPPHMQQSWNLLGFDAKRYDPIEDAPEK